MNGSFLFAVSGASGTGKTTLARALAARTGMRYHEASFGRMAASLGYDAVAPMGPDARLGMQEAVLEALLAELPRQGRAVLDRAPLDQIGYVLGEQTMNGPRPDLGARTLAYVDRCLEATASSFAGVIFVGPLPSYEATAARPGANPAYQQMVQWIIEGAFSRIAGRVASLSIETADFGHRIDAASEFLSAIG